MFKNIKDKRAFEKIVDQIKDALLKGELKVGDKLPSENEMVHLFGVSRHVVREALRILELSGLVIIRHGSRGGAFVQEVINNPQQLKDYFSDHLRLGNIDIKQLTEARYWIESTIIDIVGSKGRKKDFEILRNSINNAERLLREGKENEKIYENFNFHVFLAKISHNRILIDNVSAILELMSYIMVKVRPTRRITENTFEAHKKILGYIESGDIEKAKQVNKVHINDVSTRLIEKYLGKEKTFPYSEPQFLEKVDVR